MHVSSQQLSIKGEGLLASLRRPSIGKKLGMAFLFFGAVAMGTTLMVERLYHDMISVNWLTNESGKLRYLSQEIAYKATRLAWTRSPDLAEELPFIVQGYEDRLATVEDAALALPYPMNRGSVGLDRHLAELRETWGQYRRSVLDLANAPNQSAATLALQELDARAGRMLVIADNVVSELDQAMKTAHTFIDHLILAILLLDTAFIFILFYWIHHRVSVPVRQIAHAVRRFAAGDRSLRLHYRHDDEIGMLATDVNHTAGEIDRLIRDLDGRIHAQAQLTAILEATPDMVITVEPSGRLIWANHAGRAFIGVAPESDICLLAAQDFIHPGHRQAFLDQVMPAILRDGSWSGELSGITTDGGAAPYSVVGLAHRDAKGAVAYVSFIARDISARKLAEEELRLLRRGIESAVNAIVITDASRPDNAVIYTNPAFERITGYRPDEAVGHSLAFLQRNETDQPQLQEIRLALKEQREGRALLRNYRKDGTPFWNDLYIAPVRDDSGVSHYIGVLNDVTETKRYEAELERQSTRDELTGLPNRSLIRDRIDQSVGHAVRHESRLAVLLLDLDRFKLINDSYGHTFGDRLLRAVSERIVECVRSADTVGRQGADEFVIVLTDLARDEEVAVVAAKMLAAFAKPFHLEGRELFINASLGIAFHPRDGLDGETLLKTAEAALYQAKEQGRNTFRFYDKAMNRDALARLELERDLRHALERDELLLYYQPKVDLADNRMAGVEALVRWQHPKRGRVSPAEFIPVAEETGLIEPIGEWVLQTACTQMQTWQRAGLGILQVAVNLSACQFRNPELRQHVAAILERSGLRPECLELELTESMLMNEPEAASKLLTELKALGVSLSVDDFGTGYSSLAYLKRFPIDKLKIDQSFVRNLPADQEDAALVRAIISLGKSLALDLIAEGVETAEQRDFLLARDCGVAQGYFFAKPMPAEELEKWLAAWPVSSSQS